jgi:hypothetical protein
VHSWPAELIRVQPYSMLPLIRGDLRRVTMPNGAVIISEAMGTVRRLDPFVATDPYSMVDILSCLVAPRHVQLQYREKYGDQNIIMRVEVPGIEKIAEGVRRVRDERQERAAETSGRRRGAQKQAATRSGQRAAGDGS